MAQTATSHGFELLVPPEIRHQSRFRSKLLLLGAGTLALGGVLLVAFSPWRAAPPEFRSLPVERRTITSLVEATGYLEVITRTEGANESP